MKRYVSDAEGSLGMETSTTGGRVLQLIDLHGDVIARVSIADGGVEAQWQLLRFSKFDEFGNYVSLTPLDNELRMADRYGWLGGPQRSGEALGSVVRMGARLYDPASGRFSSVDPVPGGSISACDYCNANPVNCTDLNGLRSLKKPKWLNMSSVGKLAKSAANSTESWISKNR